MESVSKPKKIVEATAISDSKPKVVIQKKHGVRAVQTPMRRSERIRYNSRPKHEYTPILARQIRQLRRDQKDSIGERNIVKAIVKYSASKTDELTAISGKDSTIGLPAPRKRSFETFDIRHERAFDAEVKIFEHLDKKFKTIQPVPKASVFVHSELPVCDSCRSVIQQFKDKYNDVTVFTSYSLLDQL